MIWSAQTNVIDVIRRDGQVGGGNIVALEGFYSLDINFNDAPYYFVKNSDGSFSRTTSKNENALLGYIFKINNYYFCAGKDGIFHLENNGKMFNIDSLYFLQQTNANIIYHAKYTVKSSKEEIVDVVLPKPYSKQPMQNVKQYVQTISKGQSIQFGGNYSFYIEASTGSKFTINQKEYQIGQTEYLHFPETASAITYNSNNEKETDDVIILTYTKGG